jgi:zinc transport system ATP-binding protein
MTPPIVELSDVSIVRHRESLLSHVSLHVNRASLHVLVGPNGAGKTTLVMALLGLIAFEGRIAAHWERDGRIGYVPQAFAVDPSLPVTVEDFLALTRQQRPVCFGISAATRARVSSLLQEVGAGNLERRALSVLSGGELRRVLFANALDPMPELLILDEPASGLDEAGARQLEERLVALKTAGTSIIMVSHDLELVRRVADRVTVLDRRVIAEGSPADALSHADVLAVFPAGKRQ